MSPEEFREFCAEQAQRLGQFRQFEFMPAAAQKDYRKWLQRKCATPEQAERLMDAATELDQMPTLADLGRLLADLVPPAKKSAPNAVCKRCGGTGWEIIARGGAEGAIRCPEGCVGPEHDASTTVAFSGSGAEHKRLRAENSAFAAELARDLAGSLVPPKLRAPCEAELLAEIEQVKAEQELKRKSREETPVMADASE